MHTEEIMQDFSWISSTPYLNNRNAKEGGKTCMHVCGMISMDHVGVWCVSCENSTS